MAPMQLNILAMATAQENRDLARHNHFGGDDAHFEIPSAYAMSKAKAQAVRKRGGSSRWVQKLFRMSKGFIDATQESNDSARNELES